jgi:hypothetical protein
MAVATQRGISQALLMAVAPQREPSEAAQPVTPSGSFPEAAQPVTPSGSLPRRRSRRPPAGDFKGGAAPFDPRRVTHGRSDSDRS